mgnify:CR=1 FL=1
MKVNPNKTQPMDPMFFVKDVKEEELPYFDERTIKEEDEEDWEEIDSQ